MARPLARSGPEVATIFTGSGPPPLIALPTLPLLNRKLAFRLEQEQLEPEVKRQVKREDSNEASASGVQDVSEIAFAMHEYASPVSPSSPHGEVKEELRDRLANIDLHKLT